MFMKILPLYKNVPIHNNLYSKRFIFIPHSTGTGKLVRGRLKGNKIEIAFNCKKKSYMKTEKIRLFLNLCTVVKNPSCQPYIHSIHNKL